MFFNQPVQYTQSGVTICWPAYNSLCIRIFDSKYIPLFLTHLEHARGILENNVFLIRRKMLSLLGMWKSWEVNAIMLWMIWKKNLQVIF